MSDTSQGEGWWLASDGKWYPPQPSVASIAQKTNELAIASMVLGILWLLWIGSILAIVFGHISLAQIKGSDGSQKGRGMAITGLVLGYGAVGWIVVIILLTTV